MSQFFNTIKDVKTNYKVYDEWEQAQADEKAQKQYLAKTIEIPQDKLEITKNKAKAVIRATEMLDKRSEDNAENMELATEMVAGFAMGTIPALLMFLASMSKKVSAKTLGAVNIANIGVALAGGIGFILWGNKKQKEASRIGRFQAKQNELKDVKNFVIYTPEQIAKAEEIAKQIPNKKERKNILKTFKDLRLIQKDKPAYQAWAANRNSDEIEQYKSLKYTKEQLAQGNEDKEIIVDAVKDINISAEEYSENVENLYDTIGVFSGLIAIPFGLAINKVLKLFKEIKPSTNKILSIAVPIATTFGILANGTKAQKEASRIGRYKARKELLANPSALMNFTEEEKQQAQNIKAEPKKRGLFQKIGENLSFMKTFSKDKSEYTKYKKTGYQEQEQIMEALSHTEVSDAQLKEGKHLQEKLFTAFDEIDEMSQRYSEDTEAATEIAKQAGSTLWSLGTIMTPMLIGLAFVKGKLPVDKIIKNVSNLILDKSSNIRKLINNGAQTLNENKSLRKTFNNMSQKASRDAILKSPELATVIEGLTNEAATIGIKSIQNEKAMMEEISKHLKKTPFSSWLRNLILDSVKLYGKRKIPKTMMTKELNESLKFNYKNYKTLCKTGLIGGAPILATIIGVPYAFNAWLTNIQKKSGKIGIMKAMEKIDNPEVFVNSQTVNK